MIGGGVQRRRGYDPFWCCCCSLDYVPRRTVLLYPNSLIVCIGCGSHVPTSPSNDSADRHRGLTEGAGAVIEAVRWAVDVAALLVLFVLGCIPVVVVVVSWWNYGR